MGKRLVKNVMTGMAILSALGISATPVFASIPNGTVVFGDGKAYDLTYANSAANVPTILQEVTNNKSIWVNNFSGALIDNNTGLTVPATTAPATMQYTNQTGVVTTITPTPPAAAVAVASVSVVNATTVTATLVTATTGKTATDFTVLVNGTAVTTSAVTADSTGANYTITVPTMNNQQGTVSVNGTSANFDYQAPSIKSVTAIDSTHVAVTFSEPVASLGANTAANYSIVKIVPGTNPTVNAASLSADKTTVTLTLSAAMVSSPKGYDLQIPNAQTNKVSDAAGNVLALGSEFTFDGVSTTDVTPPTLIASTFDAANGVLTLNFSEQVTVASTSLSGVTLTNGTASLTLSAAAGDTISANTSGSTTQDSQLKVQLAAADKASALALGSTLTMNIAAGSFADLAATPNQIAAVSNVAVASAPAYVSGSYNQVTKEISLTFNKVVDVTKVNLSAITINVGATAVPLNLAGSPSDRDVLKTTANASTIVIGVGNVDIPKIEVPSASFSVKLTAGAVQDLNQVASGAVSTGTFTFTADTSQTSASSIVYNDAFNILKVSFTKSLDSTTVAASTGFIQILGKDDTGNALTITPSSVVMDAAPNAIDITLSGNTFITASGNVLANVNRSSLQFVMNPSASQTAIKDVNETAVQSILSTNNQMITYTDLTAPYLTLADPLVSPVTYLASSSLCSATTIAKTFVTVVFDEKVDPTTIVAGNFKIAASDNALNTLAVNSATLRADGYTVDLGTADQSSFAGKVLKATVSGVKDIVGNVISSTDTSKYIGYINPMTGTTMAAPALTTGSIVYKDANGDNRISQGDQITMSFTMPVTLAQGVTSLGSGDIAIGGTGTPTLGTGFSATVVNGQTLQVTLGASPSLTLSATTVSLTTSGEAKIVNAYNVPMASTVTATIPFPTSSAAPKLTTALITDTSKDGILGTSDVVVFTFDHNIQPVSGLTLNTLLGSATTTGYFGTANSSIALTSISANQVSGILAGTAVSATAFTSGVISGDLGASATVMDVWGQGMTTNTAFKLTPAVATAPAIVSVQLEDKDRDVAIGSGDIIDVTFNQPITFNSGAISQLELTQGGTTSGITSVFAITNSAVVTTGTAPYTMLALTLSGATKMDLTAPNNVYFNVVPANGATAVVTNAYTKAVAVPDSNALKITIKQ